MKKIFYIEDDADIAKSVKSYLENKEFLVSVFDDISSAQSAIKDSLPALCLIDINLSGGSGKELCRWIRKNYPELPVIFITVKNETKDIISGFDIGADDYITKPFEMRELIADMPRRCGATVLISSHLLSELEQIIDQVGIINKGRLLFQGPLEQLQRHRRQSATMDQDTVYYAAQLDGDTVLRVLDPACAKNTLARCRIGARWENGAFVLPAMQEQALAQVVRALAENGAGVVAVGSRTKTLEDIFLSLTERKEAE